MQIEVMQRSVDEQKKYAVKHVALLMDRIVAYGNTAKGFFFWFGENICA